MSGISERWERWYSSEECAKQYGQDAAMIGRRMAAQLTAFEREVDSEASRVKAEKEAWGGEAEAFERRVAKMRALGVTHWSNGKDVITLAPEGT